MHSYELDGRGRVAIALAVFSVFLVWLLDMSLNAVGFEPDWWLSLPSFGGFYGILHRLFDQYLWRCAALKKLGLIRVPDLNGEWTGGIRSSHVPDGETIPVRVLIKQRWSKLAVRLEATHSSSDSVMARLSTGDVVQPTLDYMYVNEPGAGAWETMHAHRGTAMLEFKDGVLEGDYYTGRDRREIGTIRLQRKQNTGR